MDGTETDHRRSVSRSAVELGMLGLVMGASVACGADTRPSLGHTVVDSAGVRIVESSAPGWVEGEEWIVPAEPEVVIGETEGDERYLLDNVHGVRRFRDGRIAILDRGSSSIRVYGPEGRHLFDAGGPGEGPTEFSRPQHLELLGDTMVVYEYSPPTLTWFDSEGRFLGSARVNRPENARIVSPRAFALDGPNAVFVTGFPLPSPGQRAPVRREPMAVWRLGTGQTEPDSIADVLTKETAVIGSRGGNAIVQDVLFGATSYVAASAGRIYLASSEAYSIQVLDPQGTVRQINRRNITPVKVQPVHLRRYVEQISAATFDPPEDPEDWIRRLADGPVAEVMPAYRLVLVDASGNLWVEEWEDVGVRQGPFSVFDPEGVWMGRVRLPPDLPWTRGLKFTMEIGEDYILGTWIADLGVEQVRLYRIEKG